MRRAARRIVEKLRLHGHQALYAGGWVRDFLLSRKPKDIDIATSALPDEVVRIFPHARPIGAKFGVIQVILYGHAYEVATFRSDSAYLDGRHPASVTFSVPEKDALRRDFTINGLFYDPLTDRLIDYVHGRSDIRAKRIRTIGKPEERFTEDKLRMLRAIRLACDLDFRIVPETWNAIRRLAPGILRVSWERIRDELTKILTGPAPAAGLDLLYQSGLLKHILPEVDSTRGIPQIPGVGEGKGKDVFTHTRDAMSLLRHPSAILAFGTLLHETGKASRHPRETESPDVHAETGAIIAEEICRRLRMSNEEVNRVVDLVRSHVEFYAVMGLRESSLIRFLRRPNFAELLELFRVHSLSNGMDPEIYFFCLEKLRQYGKQIKAAPLITGDDLIAMGYAPGPVFKKILQAIEDLQLEGNLRTRKEALSHVKTAFPLPASRLH